MLDMYTSHALDTTFKWDILCWFGFYYMLILEFEASKPNLVVFNELILKVQNLRVWIFECRDPSYQAFKLGFAAAVLLAFAHAIANLFGGCHCVWSKPELDRATSNKQLAMASLILSWY